MNRPLFALIVWSFLGAGLPAMERGPRIEKTINRDWVFQYLPDGGGSTAPASTGFDDARWPAVALPHTWSTFETTGDVHPFIKSATERDDSYWWYGWGWYRKHLVIGPEEASRLISLEFDGVQKYARVYFNGVLVGEHKGGYTGFSIDVTPQVRFGKDNVLAVQVSNRRDDPFGGIPPMTAGNFDVYGGIYRDVRLAVTDRLHVPFQGSAAHEGGTFVTTPGASEARAPVNVRTWVGNDYAEARACTVTTTLVDASGRVLGSKTSGQTVGPGRIEEFAQALAPIENPSLWSPDHPYLYEIRTEVREGQRVADTYRTPLGIRWFKWDYAQNRLYLNGKKTLLRGINRHQEFPWLGDAMPKWMHEKDLIDIRRNMGLNFQRTVHYPNDPHTYDLCDRLGFLLIEESPNIKDIAFGRGIQKEDLVEAIRRDRNHPSIIIWSLGNETIQPADSAWAAEEDPTRIRYLRRGENGGNFVQLTDKNLPIENLLRCTVRGWYGSDDHSFGAEGPNPDSGQVAGTEEWQYEKCVTSGRLADQNVVVWLYADHGADRNYLNSPLKNINPKGWVDAYRFPKYVYYLWEANFSARPMAFVHPTYWRPRYLGQKRDIVVDSNCPSVELKVDGRSLGVRHPTDANAHSVTFPGVAVVRGTVSAVGSGLGSGAIDRLPMAGKPVRLVLTVSPAIVPADRSGISVASLDIVDADGVHVFGANPPLTWSVSGPGKLAGPSNYATDTAKRGAREGTMYIDAPVANVVRSTAVPGDIVVTVTAPGYAPVQASVHSVAPAPDAIPAIIEPHLDDSGRRPVERDRNFRPARLAPKAHALAEISHDFDLKGGSRVEWRREVEAFVRSRNPKVDVFSSEYRQFVERITSTVAEREGHLIADDYNFNVRAFNERIAHPANP